MTDEKPAPKRRTRAKKPAEAVEPVQFTPDEPEALPRRKAEPFEFEPASERHRSDAPEPLASSGLVAYNEAARNSRSVRTVQEALVERGHWQVQADPAGYWGEHTARAGEAETGKTDPAEVATALGFPVI